MLEFCPGRPRNDRIMAGQNHNRVGAGCWILDSGGWPGESESGSDLVGLGRIYSDGLPALERYLALGWVDRSSSVNRRRQKHYGGQGSTLLRQKHFGGRTMEDRWIGGFMDWWTEIAE